MREQQCKYCAAEATGNHKDTCPTKDTNPEWAKSEWQKGFDWGFNDKFIAGWALVRYYSHPFIRGYEKGRDEIQELVDQAWEDRMNGVGQNEY